MKKMDVVFVVIVLGIVLILFGIYLFLGKQEAQFVVAEYNGEELGRYPLNDDIEIMLNDTNKLSIQDGMVKISEATCKDQICVMHNPIQKNGESIICLPNKIVVTIESAETKE